MTIQSMSRLVATVAAALVFATDAARAADFPDPAIDVKAASGAQTAVLAGGCFWCTEAVFEIIEGVEDVVSGYSGGTKETAKYDIVSTGRRNGVRSEIFLPACCAKNKSFRWITPSTSSPLVSK